VVSVHFTLSCMINSRTEPCDALIFAKKARYLLKSDGCRLKAARSFVPVLPLACSHCWHCLLQAYRHTDNLLHILPRHSVKLLVWYTECFTIRRIAVYQKFWALLRLLRRRHIDIPIGHCLLRAHCDGESWEIFLDARDSPQLMYNLTVVHLMAQYD
jgi:hypothetical protein